MAFARAFESSFLAWDIEPLFAIRGRWEESCRKVRSSWLLSLPQRPLFGLALSLRWRQVNIYSNREITPSLFLSFSYPFIFPFFPSFPDVRVTHQVPPSRKNSPKKPETNLFSRYRTTEARLASLDLRGFNIESNCRSIRGYLLGETSKQDT